MQGRKYSHICKMWGKFLPAGMICTTTDTISTLAGEMYLHARMFCARAHMSSIPMGAINFYMQEHFLHWLIPLLFSCLRCIYMQDCSVHSLRVSSIPMGASQSLKPVLSQCSQTGFVAVDDFIALYAPSYVFYSLGAINSYKQARTFFTLADTIAPTFTVLTKVWPRANRAMVTNN